MKNKVLSIFLIFFIFVASATVALAAKETQLTHGERLTLRTSIYGNYVFWTETTANDVHAYDLTTGKRLDINGHYAHSQINAYGNKVVWTGDDGDAVYIYDISKGNETKIASERRDPDIYNNYVVYTNNYYYGEDPRYDGIYLYDLNAHKETKIANVYSSPAVYGKNVVWAQDNKKNGSDIRKYDISTHKTSTIITTNSPVSELDIYGNVVVWIGSGNVYMYDLAAHKKIQVAKNGNACQPSIYGNRIVYTVGDPYSSGRKDIFMYEISAAKTIRITASTLAFGPSVYDQKIVYADCRNDPKNEEIRDVYLYDLKPKLKNKNNIHYRRN